MGGYSDEDLENEEHEFGGLEEDSPVQESSYLPNGLSGVTSMPNGGAAMTLGGQMSAPSMAMAAPSQLMQTQHLLHGQM